MQLCPIIPLLGFQSTPPVKAATEQRVGSLVFDGISIHAAREGGDPRRKANSKTKFKFQSTPPVKAATPSSVHIGFNSIFQSTPPVKAATLPYRDHMERGRYFNPRRP